MATYLILAQSDTTARALGAWLELLGEPALKEPDETRKIVCSESGGGGKERAILTYENVVRQIEVRVGDQHGAIPLNDVVILVDSLKPANLNPLTDGGGWDALVAMLLLTFPEIRWVFGVLGKDASPDLHENHTLTSLLAKPRRDPLFDATGLRNAVRENVNTALTDGTLPVRKQRAAAIDEETNYALFHAYAAYRFGYRADAVRSWALMEHLFGAPASPHAFNLLLEDVNLNFPDKPGRTHLSDFAQYTHTPDGETGRARHCPRLVANREIETSDFRIIVSSGHSGTDADKMRKNREFVENYKGWEKSGFVLKPVGGMFDLWAQAKFFKRLPRRRDDAGLLIQQGHAAGFQWPPPVSKAAQRSGGHSAPGKLMLIAQHLVRRADALRDSANTVDECIRGAVLATDALELLRYQTPTLALQALCLKHEFEVKAEVAFLGVGYHFDLERRFAELEREVKEASRFFDARRRRSAELDTLVSIGNRLMLVFRNAGQFDEEQSCMARIRSWHRLLRFHQTRNPLEQIANGIMAYAEFLLAKPTRYLIALFVWYVVLVGLWWGLVPVTPELTCDHIINPPPPNELLAAMSIAWNTFVAANPSEANCFAGYVLSVIGSAAGLFHLGVFISYLYSVVTRK